jgi:hypothetical protein
MRALYAAARLVWELFVEDARLTVGILVCIALAVYLVPRIGLPPRWRGPALFLGLGIVLLENVRRSAQKRGQTKGPLG